MPCVFLRNLPETFFTSTLVSEDFFKPSFSAADMYKKIAEAAGCGIDDVEVHLSNETYRLLSQNGHPVSCSNVHGEVEWHGSEDRGIKVKQAIADALQQYLNSYLVGEGFDLAFHDSPAGTFFVEKNGKSVLVEGGEYIPPSKVLAQVAYEVVGHESPGIITSD